MQALWPLLDTGLVVSCELLAAGWLLRTYGPHAKARACGSCQACPKQAPRSGANVATKLVQLGARR